MVPVGAQHMEHGMPIGMLHAATSFAYHAAMAMESTTPITHTLLVLDKVLIVMMAYEIHVWADISTAVTYEPIVTIVCMLVGAFTWWLPIAVDVMLTTYVAIVMVHVHAIAESRKTHLAVATIGAVSYVLGVPGVMHACLCWGIGAYHRWIRVHKKAARREPTSG